MDYKVIEEYMRRVQAVYATGVTTEHSFRAALGFLFDSIDPKVRSINEPKQLTKIGRPDFVFHRTVGDNFITLGHCEAKDIDKDVDPRAMRKENKNQFERYNQGLPNLIYTNCLDFHFYKNGELINEIRIADFAVGISPITRRYPVLVEALKSFAAERLQTITSAKRLASLMAGKAKLIKNVMFESINEDANVDSDLVGQFKAFKTQLIHDLTPESFADIYAETVVYGMFAARLKDQTKEDFSRIEALELLPKSNPFLRDLFSYVAGPNLDERIRRDIDELAEIFVHVDPDVLFQDFGRFTKRNDPFIHFYETFLAEYNPKKRKARGVWYTPESVVNFIIRAVDDVLKSEFGLRDGLADTSKISIERSRGQAGLTKAGKVRKDGKKDTFTEEVHRVQILDPATGTGTFLAETIKQIGARVKKSQPGNWSSYVENELIPRVHGFELLMASYAMCHMKLDMMLADMGYVPTTHQPRLSVYLTNSLEEGEKATYELPFANFLSKEANAANEVKRDKPIMCIIGNPPYSGESSNKGDWIMGLMEAYKREPGGKAKLKERNPKWVNDDYVKFIRMSEHMIEQNGEGVLAFITNHGYLDNPTFRGMRWHLLQTFDIIRVIDLHGNSKKFEVSPDGSRDVNVFDIQTGVAILVCSKTKASNPNKGRVFFGETWGEREDKGNFLFQNATRDVITEVRTQGPEFPFVPRNWELLEKYECNFQLTDLFKTYSNGITFGREKLNVDFKKSPLIARLKAFRDADVEEARRINKLKKDARDWKVHLAQSDLKQNWDETATKISYRPFDYRYSIYTGVSRGIHCYPRQSVSGSMIDIDNTAVVFRRQSPNSRELYCFVANEPMADGYIRSDNKGGETSAPLYVRESELDKSQCVNMDEKIRKKIEKLGTDEKHGVPDEIAIFDYIYGVLHCPAYRETYAEFLKIDFPRVPYPSSPSAFWDISTKGTELRKLHLMKPEAIGETDYVFQGEGDPIVDKPNFEPTSETHGIIRINKTHHFENVPKLAWEFYIGGYQPAQKWLKDRKGTNYNEGKGLDYNDIRHYQDIIKILSETDRIMKTIKMAL